MRKRISALLLAVCLLLSTLPTALAADPAQLQTIRALGIMQGDENGDLIGFDIELAKAVAEALDLTVEFKEIDWNAKEALLEGKSIDCIWNGMTITEERLEKMEISIPYLNNKQVAVIRVEDKDLYTTLESMSKAIVAAEAGSAGEACVVKPAEEE